MFPIYFPICNCWVYRADGLTLEKRLEIVPRLASRRHLELPKNLLNSEEQQQLKGELNNRRPSPISFRFANPKGIDIYNKNCYYLVDENEDAEEEGMEGIVEDDQDMWCLLPIGKFCSDLFSLIWNKLSLINRNVLDSYIFNVDIYSLS